MRCERIVRVIVCREAKYTVTTNIGSPLVVVQGGTKEPAVYEQTAYRPGSLKAAYSAVRKFTGRT